MPTPRTPTALLQQALDYYERYGSYELARRALAEDGHEIPKQTYLDRVKNARLAGLKPQVKREEKRVWTPNRLGKMHLVIPDVQMKDGVPDDHMEWIGNFIVDKQPDTIVCIGDFADMPSLSIYEKGKLPFEGRRYVKDLHSVHNAMRKLLEPIAAWNRVNKVKYRPRKVLTLGNHEHRISRIIDENPEYEGKFSLDDLQYKEFGWEVHPFLKVVSIDGVEYSHYFTSGVMGRPVSSAAVLLRERQGSAVMGHVQYMDLAVHRKTQKMGMFVGTCYLHNEPYLGPQGNSQRRQIVVLHEVEDGQFDPMFVSLRFLQKAYG